VTTRAAHAPGPVIETARLILRPPAAEDFPRWAEAMENPASSRFIGGPQAPAAAWRGFMTMAGAWTLDGIGMFSLIEKASGLWMGRIGPWRPHGWPGNEVGWGLHVEGMGKGYGLEAAVVGMDYAFDVLGWDDVIHCIDPQNTPSQALAMRLGSRRIGPTTLPPPYEHIPSEKWGQDRAAWRLNRARLTG
jgi:RimJ/RimL family protein N-acetyltransferase